MLHAPARERCVFFLEATHQEHYRNAINMSSTAESFAGYLESHTYLYNTSQTPGGGGYPLTLDTSNQVICSIQLQITDLGIKPLLGSICQCFG